MPKSHSARSINQSPPGGLVIGHMEYHRVGRGLDFGHGHPCPAEPPSQVRRRLSPGICRPGVQVGRLEMVTTAKRRRDRVKFAATPIVHSLACSRGSM
jgi:hypothetical protein